MKKFLVSATLVAGFAMTSEAQIARVFVSVGGNDGNDCLQPATACRTLNGGIGKVDVGGEVILVDTGSYAGATVTKSVKINVPSGNVAFSGLPITVNAPGATVVLRGLTLKALTPGSGTGVSVLAASAVFIENCVIDGWNKGVEMLVAGELYIKDSTIRNNVLRGVETAVGTLNVESSRFERTTDSLNGVAVFVRSGSNASLVRSLFTHSANGVAVVGGSAMVDECEASNNTAGFTADTGGILRVLNSTATGNGTGFQNITGTLETFGNNVVRANGMNTSGGITMVGKQ